MKILQYSFKKCMQSFFYINIGIEKVIMLFSKKYSVHFLNKCSFYLYIVIMFFFFFFLLHKMNL